ncbi:hypothetical protein [Saccharopolyspora phatthalungensis]|uniref:Plasmid replication, integration and excision activator n=1 Tax=Saccharopolyspora phatthalungensis TaxID=664693 RepID=A0A840QAB6_9PSEU|nr:hypothetical protein [Saccharopolyspora phatthalungensis]MBB5157356.1 hypothetical protein [Saccharopolyspora phatthalungensis]
MGARVVSGATPAEGKPDDEAGPRQRIDAETGLPVWLITVADLASVRLTQTAVTVEILAENKPVLPQRPEIEFVGLTVEPVRGGTEKEPWTTFTYRALEVVAAPRRMEDTRPLPMALWLGEPDEPQRAGSPQRSVGGTS